MEIFLVLSYISFMEDLTGHKTAPAVNQDSDPLRLAFVEARAKGYSLNIPAKLVLLEQLAEMALAARKSYRETTSGA